jgi:uncharacterized protein YigA (DUF484 family)
MSSQRHQIEELEQKNSELAKEILLNESAIYEAEREIANLDEDLLDHPVIADYIQRLNEHIAVISEKNRTYKVEIFKNNFEIKRLEDYGKE